ncbi:MAG: hypothetical protein P1V81_05925 [Planctomycetota bacterium]|nr:hypothetical protein [Planctomycetota bacterium]
MTDSHRPIVYLRGYAATASEIDATVATPYMGFNLGSTRIRQAFDGEMVPFVFESPMVRLMKDEGYQDCYEQGALRPADGKAEQRSVWIFRYYEEDEAVSAIGKRRDIEDFAADLRTYIERIAKSIHGEDVPDDFQVHLVAHSMGGLIVRCYLQRFCPDNDLDPLVDKVFTYGTPHNGIEMAGINVPDLGRLDGLDVSNFNRKRMKRYLGIPDGRPANSLEGHFPPERFFCFIGTNHKDYEAFFGLSKRGTGPMSDGLVMMKNAYVDGAPRAFAHRSHSGPYGLVNSEEGYQNLRRFLFGDVCVTVKLEVDELTLPTELQAVKDEAGDRDPGIRGKYHISTAARVRNSGYQLSERATKFGSEIRADYDEMTGNRGATKQPVYLLSGYLSQGGKAQDPLLSSDRALAFQVELTIDVPLFEIERRFWFDKHFPGGQLLHETATFHVRQGPDGPRVRCKLSSDRAASEEGSLLEPTAADGRVRRYAIPIRTPGNRRPGLRGRLILEARDWS